jgi:hypothetical protein
MRRSIQFAALAGMIGPPLFGGTVTVLTILEDDFLRGLGWEPWSLTTVIWPSGLALGPHGFVMTAAFLVNGVVVALFATGLRRALPATFAARSGAALLFLAGLAMLGLAFPTDAGHRPPVTVQGWIHDLCFVAVGLTMFPSMLALGWAFRQSVWWRGLSGYTWLTTALAVPTFAFKGAVFYVFLAAILAWTVVVAVRLRKVAAGADFLQYAEA